MSISLASTKKRREDVLSSLLLAAAVPEIPPELVEMLPAKCGSAELMGPLKPYQEFFGEGGLIRQVWFIPGFILESDGYGIDKKSNKPDFQVLRCYIVKNRK